MRWHPIEEDIVRTAKSRGEAYRALAAEGYKRTQATVWKKYQLLKKAKQ